MCDGLSFQRQKQVTQKTEKQNKRASKNVSIEWYVRKKKFGRMIIMIWKLSLKFMLKFKVLCIFSL